MYKLINPIMHYEWGTRDESAFIPQFLGEAVVPGKPYAELWIGAHPKAPSKILVDGLEIPLDQAIKDNPDYFLGSKVISRYGRNLPFLLKVLSAGQALSIQTHPNKKQAEELHAADPAHYPDNNHKPEIAIAIDKLEAIAGFRPATEIREWMVRLPELRLLVGDKLIQAVIDNPGNDSVRGVYEAIMMNADHPVELEKVILPVLSRIREMKNPDPECRDFMIQYNQYGVDVGLFSLFFFNRLNLKPGEAIFTEAGVPHAYLSGNIVECMANSDNVVRAGLTPKYKDVKTLLSILKLDCRAFPVQSSDDSIEDTVYHVPVREFQLTRYKRVNRFSSLFHTQEKPEIILCMEGLLKLATGLKELIIRRGESVLISAGNKNYRISSQEPAEWFTTRTEQV